jgi:hypothetical protein
VTVDVVVSELGDIRRFRSAKQVCAYAGLALRQRESAGRTKQLPISKEGSKLMRWILVEAGWQLVYRTRRWGSMFDSLARRRGKKKAIVAVARRLLCMMVAMLRSGRRYEPALVCTPAPTRYVAGRVLVHAGICLCLGLKGMWPGRHSL